MDAVDTDEVSEIIAAHQDRLVLCMRGLKHFAENMADHDSLFLFTFIRVAPI
jgi:hypothetical protein